LRATLQYLLIVEAFIVWSAPMMDVVMLAIGFVCFAVSIGYAYACDWL